MTDRLTVRIGSVPILSVKRSVSIDTMLNFDGDGDGHRDRDGTCKQALNSTVLLMHSSNLSASRIKLTRDDTRENTTYESQFTGRE